jgi:hypothetical protein
VSKRRELDHIRGLMDQARALDNHEGDAVLELLNTARYLDPGDRRDEIVRSCETRLLLAKRGVE